MEPTIKDAIRNLCQIHHPNAGVAIRGNDLQDMSCLTLTPETEPKFVWANVQSEFAELQAAYPLKKLRQKRNGLLAETDWMAFKDVTLPAAWETYRQKLRDLPASANPTLDENGNLTNITWPTKPE